jgi:hypothetical protein
MKTILISHGCFPLTPALSRWERFHEPPRLTICSPEPEWNAEHRLGHLGFGFGHEPRRCSAFQFRGRGQSLDASLKSGRRGSECSQILIKRLGAFLPLPKGEGRGEGEQDLASQIYTL